MNALPEVPASASETAAGPAIERETVRRTEIPGGLEFHHVESGGGLPLVFIHGALGDWRIWAPQWEAFTPHYRCISYSRRYSSPNRNNAPSPHHSALDEAQDLEALLQAWGATPALLVGSSYGAFTALALALRRPELVRAMVLAEPPMLRWADLSEEGQIARAQFDREVRLPSREAFLRGDDEHGIRHLSAGIAGPTAAAKRTPEAMKRRLENGRALKILTLSTDEFPWLAPDDVARLQVPTLLVAGARTPPIHDTVFRNLCAVMTQASICRIPDAGHSSSRDNPQAFNRAALEFLEAQTATQQAAA